MQLSHSAQFIKTRSQENLELHLHLASTRTKTITTGEGGMIVTDDKKLYEKCKFFRDQGRDVKSNYDILELGFKYMPFNLQAALGYSQFKRISEIVSKKRKIYQIYKRICRI